MNLLHVILMRYNLRMPGYAPSSDPDWMRRRCDLFEKRMLPSLEAQTSRNFVCVPLMDRERTPDDVFDRVDGWCSDIIAPAWFGKEWAINGCMYDTPAILPICQSAVHTHLLGDRYNNLLTTRMDSDDAISNTFVEKLQKEVQPNHTEFLNYWYGWIEKDGCVYPDEHGKNMFISLTEPLFQDCKPNTVHCVWHKKASTFAPVRQIGGESRMWLRGIHAENRSSKLRGRNYEHEPAPFSVLADTFGAKG